MNKKVEIMMNETAPFRRIHYFLFAVYDGTDSAEGFGRFCCISLGTAPRAAGLIFNQAASSVR